VMRKLEFKGAHSTYPRAFRCEITQPTATRSARLRFSRGPIITGGELRAQTFPVATKDRPMTDRIPYFRETLAIHLPLAARSRRLGARADPDLQQTHTSLPSCSEAGSRRLLFGSPSVRQHYPRIGNTDQRCAEERVAALEGGTAVSHSRRGPARRC